MGHSVYQHLTHQIYNAYVPDASYEYLRVFYYLNPPQSPNDRIFTQVAIIKHK